MSSNYEKSITFYKWAGNVKGMLNSYKLYYLPHIASDEDHNRSGKVFNNIIYLFWKRALKKSSYNLLKRRWDSGCFFSAWVHILNLFLFCFFCFSTEIKFVFKI